MFILTLENRAYSLVDLPDEVDDLSYSVLDNFDPKNPDFYFQPLIFLESFNSPALVLRIGDDEVTMPVDWSIAVGDAESDCDVEVLPLSSLNNRGFDALTYNPLTSFRYEFRPIEIINFYSDVKWYFPKMKPGQLLTLPTSARDNPSCCFFTKDIVKASELIQLDKLP